jgi:hypothetical protein
MPQNSAPNLSIDFTAPNALHKYDYSQLSLLSALPDSSQLEVIWDVDYVYSGAGQTGTEFFVEDLPVAIQTALKTLVLGTHYTITAESNYITIDPAAIQNQSVDTINGTFYYPITFTINGSQSLSIRRSTDITTPVVEFQPGSRLTAENLNLSSGQLFNALQEVLAFGTGTISGTISDLDLSQNNINDLGNVNLGAEAIAYWNGSSLVSGSDVGLLVPDNTTETTDGKVLMSAYVEGAPIVGPPGPSIGWENITYAEVFSAKVGGSTLQAKLGNIDTSITTLNNKTTDLSYAASVTTIANDLSVPSGDVTIQGASVYDYISHEPYFWQLSNGVSISQITGDGGIRVLGNENHFADHDSFQYSSSTAVFDFDFADGTWTAPRNMVIHVTMTFASVPDNAALIGRIRHNGISVGAPVYNKRNDGDGRTNVSVGVTFDVSLNDTVVIDVQRDGAGPVTVDNASASLHEVR